MHIAYVNEQLKTRLLRDFKFSTLCLVEFNFKRGNFIRSCLRLHERHVCGALVSNTPPLPLNVWTQTTRHFLIRRFRLIRLVGWVVNVHHTIWYFCSFTNSTWLRILIDNRRVWCDRPYIFDRNKAVTVRRLSRVVGQKIAIWEPIGPTVPRLDTI